MGSRQSALGAASALVGLGQFGLGAVVAPLVGGREAAIDLVFAPRGVAPASDVA